MMMVYLEYLFIRYVYKLWKHDYLRNRLARVSKVTVHGRASMFQLLVHKYILTSVIVLRSSLFKL